MAGTIITDKIESDATYDSKIELASPVLVSNTFAVKSTGGTGVFNIVGANTNTDRTFTLPDVAGTVFVGGQALSATTGSFSGNVTLGSSVLETPTGSAPSYTCRAWVNFDGVAVSIRGSGNVSSVNRPETGRYTVNFSTAMPDTNYSAVCNRGDESNSGAATHRDMTMNPTNGGRATGSVNLNSKQSQGGNNATNENCINGFVAIFR